MTPCDEGPVLVEFCFPIPEVVPRGGAVSIGVDTSCMMGNIGCIAMGDDMQQTRC